MVEKPTVSVFQNFLWNENWLNIKKVIGRNVWMCYVSTASTYIALNALEIVMPYVNSVDIYSIWGHCIQSRVEFSHLIVLCIRCCVKAKNTSVLTVLTNIAFNALYALIFISTTWTNKIPYTIYNSIALILCIDHLNIPFKLKRVLIKPKSFLIWSFNSK